MHRTFISLLACVLLLCAGVETTGTPAIGGEVQEMLHIIAEPLNPVFGCSSDILKDDRVILRTEVARQQLMALNVSDAVLRRHREKVLIHLQTCRECIDDLRRIDNTIPDIEGIAARSIDAAPAFGRLYNGDGVKQLPKDDQVALGQLITKLGSEGVKLAVQSSRKKELRDKYRKSLAGICIEAAQIADGNFKKTDPNYNDLGVNVGGSLGSFLDNDRVFVTNNTGKELTNCIVRISLKDMRLGVRPVTHVHFVPSWPKGEIYGAYYPSVSYQGLDGSPSVEMIEDVTVEISSDQGQFSRKYQFFGPNYDAFVENWFYDNKPQLYFTWHRNNWTSNAGIEIQHNYGHSAIPVTNITVIADGTQVRFATGSTRWESGNGLFQSKVLFNEKFNNIRPKKVRVELEFPYSTFRFWKEVGFRWK